MECKKALQKADGDLQKAEVVLRESGIAGATKKATRSTKQGIISSHIAGSGKLGVLVEVNCESDFVARTEDFQTLVSDIASHIAATKPKYVRAEYSCNELHKSHNSRLRFQELGAESMPSIAMLLPLVMRH